MKIIAIILTILLISAFISMLGALDSVSNLDQFLAQPGQPTASEHSLLAAYAAINSVADSRTKWQAREHFLDTFAVDLDDTVLDDELRRRVAQGLCPAWSHQAGRDRYGTWASLDAGGYDVTMRYLPPGRFLMGSPVTEAGRGNNETQREVVIAQGFWLAETECSQAVWYEVVGDTPSYLPDSFMHPVEQVSWEDCLRFMLELHLTSPAAQARLPTEAEWEYACRAGTSGPFHGGETLGDENHVHYDAHNQFGSATAQKHHGTTRLCGSGAPNAWGFYDMHGNVSEWCADVYPIKQLLSSEAFQDNSGINTPVVTERFAVIRGGSWLSTAEQCRSAARTYDRLNLKSKSLGFRIAISARFY